MWNFISFNCAALLSAFLDLFTYGSLGGMAGGFLVFYALGILSLLGFVPFVGVIIYFGISLAVVMPKIYALVGIASSWLTLFILVVHGFVALGFSLSMFF